MSGISRRSFLRGGAATALGLGVGIGIDHRSHSRRRAAAQSGTDTAALEDLRARLNGTLMLPGDSGYASASAPANGRYLDIRPAAVPGARTRPMSSPASTGAMRTAFPRSDAAADTARRDFLRRPGC